MAAEVERRARAAALQRQLAEWDGTYGPVSPDAAQEAARAFDDLDALSTAPERAEATRRTRRREGAA